MQVTAVKRSDPQQTFSVIVRHRLPNAAQRGEKTYEIDFLFAEEDETEDVCWRFQIIDGENVHDRFMAYVAALGKYGSGDEDFEEYVRAFQCKVLQLIYTGK